MTARLPKSNPLYRDDLRWVIPVWFNFSGSLGFGGVKTFPDTEAPDFTDSTRIFSLFFPSLNPREPFFLMNCSFAFL
jgi:hypothetical protein